MLQRVYTTNSVLQDMLPEYIPMRVAESILFAGKAVRVLRNPSPSFLSRDDVYPQVPKSLPKIHGFAGRFNFQREPIINSGVQVEDLLPQSEADKIENMLLDLKVLNPSILLYHIYADVPKPFFK
jgi:gamma-tubulin complex component 4